MMKDFNILHFGEFCSEDGRHAIPYILIRAKLECAKLGRLSDESDQSCLGDRKLAVGFRDTSYVDFLSNA